MRSYQILIVDDDDSNLISTKLLLQECGFRPVTARSGAEAIGLIRRRKEPYALILMDFEMPEMDGAQAAQEILKIHPTQQIAMHTCHGDKQTMRASFQSGVVEFLEKDMDPRILIERIKTYCENWEQTSKPIHPELELEATERKIKEAGLIGRSRKLGEAIDRVCLFAPFTQTILLQGESGCGKELIAASIHKLSPRKNHPFLALNCAAIPENLIENELFGHERGAFTGATHLKRGRFDMANGGTLFLDEIGDMSLATQAKVLRVIQEQKFERVGGSQTVSVDVRLVAASHKNLKALVERGLFREDLYYRLDQVVISIPPLRERTEDIEPLVAHFTKAYCEKNGIEKSFQRATLPILAAYSWPGNVRELKNVVERHLISCPEKFVGVEHLEGVLSQVKPRPTIKDLESKHEIEMRNLIIDTLSRFPKKTDAAQALGIKPNLLSYYLKTYGISA